MRTGFCESRPADGRAAANKYWQPAARTPAWRTPGPNTNWSYSDFLTDVGRCGTNLGLPPSSVDSEVESALTNLFAALLRAMRGHPGYRPEPRFGSTACFDLMVRVRDSFGSAKEPECVDDEGFGARPPRPYPRPLPQPAARPDCSDSFASIGDSARGHRPDLTEALCVLVEEFPAIARCGKVGVDELRAAMQGNSSRRLARAASTLLSNPVLLDGLRGAYARTQGLPSDGSEGLPIQAFQLGQRLAKAVGGGREDALALRMLEAYFDKAARYDGNAESVSIADLQAAARDRLQPELADAARRILDDVLLRNGVDGAGDRLAGNAAMADGSISRLDILASLRSMPLDTTDADLMAVLGRYQDSLWPGGKPLTLAQVRDMALGKPMPDGGLTTKELMTAMHRLQRSSALIDRLDAAGFMDRLRRSGHPAEPGAARALDGLISLEDFRALASTMQGLAASDRAGVRRIVPAIMRPRPDQLAGRSEPPAGVAGAEQLQKQYLGAESLGSSVVMAMLQNRRNNGDNGEVVRLLTRALSSFATPAEAA